MVGVALMVGVACGPFGPGTGAHPTPTYATTEVPEDVSTSFAAPKQPIGPLPRGSFRVPIVMYHYIRNNPDPADKMGEALSVPPEKFQREMDWLRDNGYSAVTFDDLQTYLSGRRPPPAHPVVLTFDDGYADFYTTAMPILRQHTFIAVAYVVTGFLNRPGYLTSEQVFQLDHGDGVQIGVHSVSHPDLTRVPPGQLQHELVDSRSTLERLLGHKVLDFCYPGGRFNDAVIRAVQAAGYRDATTTQPGTVHSAADRYSWTRVRAGGQESMEDFVKDVTG